jgi:hypothetical protein
VLFISRLSLELPRTDVLHPADRDAMCVEGLAIFPTN